MSMSRVVEYAFFFALLAGAGYFVWIILSPFVSALALSTVIVTICYPMYERIKSRVYKQNKTLAAAISTLAVVVIIILPLIFISSLFVKELVSFYQTLGAGQELTIEKYVLNFESVVQNYIPSFDLNITEQIRQGAEWLVRNIGAIFAGTVSTGFTIFGIDRAVLWGAVGAILAMIPGLGTLAIMVPGIFFLAISGAVPAAIGLAIWTVVTVIVVDNIIAPHLMSRGNNLHPFIMLTSVMGGISTFGPIGFIIGPVIVTLFTVLLEVYNQYLAREKKRG